MRVLVAGAGNRGRFAHASGGSPGAQLVHNVNYPPRQGLGPSNALGLPGARMPTRPMGGNVPGENNGGVPGRYAGPAIGNNPPLTTKDAPPQLPQGPIVLGVGQESAYRGGVYFANDKLITSDRHAYLKTGTEKTGRKSGQTDPPVDGPARPSLATVNRTVNFQQGSDATRNADDFNRPYARNSAGMYVGEQGSGWSPVYGGVPGLYQPYGSYAGVTNGPVKGIQSPVAEGSQMDGPRKVFSGPPHGLHTRTFPSYSQTLGYYMSVPGMRPGRIDRPSNSPIAGQSFSQLVLPQGASGTTSTRTRMTTGRVRPSGWKGM